MTITDLDSGYMQRALKLARRGLYTTDPNPRVGAVLVNDGRVVGEGWHVRAGEPHAERHALAQAGPLAQGATCYVTLEPCSHTGRTGPCADALVEAGVRRVVAAMQDPNPQVSGQGLARLRAAGITVECGVLEAEARALNPGFIKRMESGLPLVRIKLAMSLDGRTAMASGESQWITGAPARQSVQRLRARSSAIVTGIGTVLADNPALTVRPEDWPIGEYPGALRQPLRVVLDRRLQIPLDARLLAQPGEVWVISAASDALASAIRASGAQVLALPGSGSGTDLMALLRLLGQHGCNEVLVEAGATLAGAFVREQLWDELVVFMAPTLLGSSARPLLLLPEMATMAEQKRMTLQQVESVGEDLCLTYVPQLSH